MAFLHLVKVYILCVMIIISLSEENFKKNYSRYFMNIYPETMVDESIAAKSFKIGSVIIEI